MNEFTTSNTLASGSPKINSTHHQRLAYVYVRQSTMQQVEHHRGSQINQYHLVERAQQLGWSPVNIHVIDEDLGKTGREATQREGFNKLLSEVSLGRVGIILGYEVSRLARNNSDWYRLLDLAAVFGTVIADSDGVYDSRLYNDRLLLGLKGAMSEAEIHLLRLRLGAGKLSLIKSGQYRQSLPTGLICLEDGTVVKDPDLQVQHALTLVFDKFAELKSMHSLLRYLHEQHITIPRRRYSGLHVSGELVWKLPSLSAIKHILCNPAYAGAFAYGRSQTDPTRRKPGQIYTPRVDKPQAEWIHLQLGVYPAYITWEQYQSNQAQIQQNILRFSRHSSTQSPVGVPRQGAALLQGLAVCGRCGCHMSTLFHSTGSQIGAYSCSSNIRLGGQSCQCVSAAQIDAAVVNAFFEAIQPAELDALQGILQRQQLEHDRLTQHWQDRLRRAQYQAQLAQRQYNAVDPTNRLVAASLEQRWEEQLTGLRQVEQDYAQFQRDQANDSFSKSQLSADLVRSFKQLSVNLPKLWNSDRLDIPGKKALLRSLIAKVVLNRDRSDHVEIRIVWISGHCSQLSTWIPVKSATQLTQHEIIIERIRELSALGWTDVAIAEQLTREGFHSARSNQVKRVFVAKTRTQLGILRPQWLHCRSDKIDGRWTCHGLAKHLNIQTSDIVYRIRVGIIPSEWVSRDPLSSIYLIQDAPDLLDRIRQTRRITASPPKGAF